MAVLINSKPRCCRLALSDEPGIAPSHHPIADRAQESRIVRALEVAVQLGCKIGGHVNAQQRRDIYEMFDLRRRIDARGPVVSQSGLGRVQLLDAGKQLQRVFRIGVDQKLGRSDEHRRQLRIPDHRRLPGRRHFVQSAVWRLLPAEDALRNFKERRIGMMPDEPQQMLRQQFGLIVLHVINQQLAVHIEIVRMGFAVRP